MLFEGYVCPSQIFSCCSHSDFRSGRMKILHVIFLLVWLTVSVAKIIQYWWQINEWVTNNEKPKCSKEKPTHCHFFYYKSHMDWPVIKPGPLWWQTSGYLPEPWHSPILFSTRIINHRPSDLTDDLMPCYHIFISQSWQWMIWTFQTLNPCTANSKM